MSVCLRHESHRSLSEQQLRSDSDRSYDLEQYRFVTAHNEGTGIG